MEIIEMRALRGPNYYSSDPVILMKLDLHELEIKPTDLVPEFKENIALMIPTLYDHECSPGKAGGFLSRDRPRIGCRKAIKFRPGAEDHHCAPDLRRPGLHHAGGGGQPLFNDKGRAGVKPRDNR